MGRSLDDDIHILGTRHGVVTAKTVRRLAPSERCDKSLLLAMKGIPSDTKAGHATVPLGQPEDMVEAMREDRRVKDAGQDQPEKPKRMG